ncbi:MAG: glutamine-hydrolyzing carbamoyl-phosphate synthase small subunit [Candidatus Omnitrophica bacterium]|nr:glutamine-hydrolyzing carbamoyl-phosphate synthase small subunit [Candidatus Omnitrophota bacterium]
MEAILALEDGTIFRGKSFGASGERYGEVVFNTSMTGYQEILTDPSYKGQIVAMTYPLIGNYGINKEDIESRGIFLEGFVVKEYSSIASSWRSQKSLGDFLLENNILGIKGIDTRKLTLHIRKAGAMKAILSTQDLDERSLVEKARSSPGLIGVDLVKEVTINHKYAWHKAKGSKYRVVVIDCGLKYNILAKLLENKCQVTVVPAKTAADEILKMKPDGIVLSNGPGDPAAVSYLIETTKKLIGKVPIFGICLGQQILGLALGGKTYKLKFGHHGANHPVKDLKTGKVSITVQNHGFCVDIGSLNKKDIEITHINLNDNTLEGMRHKKLSIFSVQFHPEASAGPHDAGYLFGEFIKMMEEYA